MAITIGRAAIVTIPYYANSVLLSMNKAHTE